MKPYKWALISYDCCTQAHTALGKEISISKTERGSGEAKDAAPWYDLVSPQSCENSLWLLKP